MNPVQTALIYNHHMKINFGGDEDADVSFNIEAGDMPDEWQVAEGLKVTYKDADITNLFEGADVEEHIYMKKDEVEQQIADRIDDVRINEMADYHEPYRDIDFP